MQQITAATGLSRKAAATDPLAREATALGFGFFFTP